jgi:hypothetical protein
MILGMSIVIRKQGGKWEKTEKVVFADEAELQRMLYESPELIPTKVEDQAVIFTREAGLYVRAVSVRVLVPSSIGGLRRTCVSFGLPADLTDVRKEGSNSVGGTMT